MTVLLSKLVSDLSRDAASIPVRVAVFKGLAYLIENPLSLPLLAGLLPHLRDSIHDPAEKVRIAMLELLGAVKGMRDIKYWDVVPIEHLLARLELEKPLAAKRIVALLASSFFPTTKADSVRIERSAVPT